MQSTLLTELTASEEANLSGGRRNSTYNIGQIGQGGTGVGGNSIFGNGGKGTGGNGIVNDNSKNFYFIFR
ncbi:hypothetical protein FM036_27605 [Nostoc sp. HG1]|nr:hypothetical protein [Nostoc sp. HG1]